MPFTGTITLTKTSAIAPNSMSIVDTSSFVDEPESTFSDRKVYLVKVDGTYVTAGNQTIAIIGVAPTATITIDSVPADGYNITITLPVSMGGATLGSYTKQSSDTTTTILAASIAAALTGAICSVNNNVISIQFLSETSDYNGDGLNITSNDISEVNATKSGFPPSQPQGTLLTITADDIALGVITLAIYTISVSDVGDTVLYNTNLIDAINSNPYGYSASVNSTTDFIVTARIGLGSTMNGRAFLISWSGGSQGGNFSGGVDAVGVIPNTITDFENGVTEGTEEVTGLDYFDWPFDSGDTIAINALTEDIALSIMVVWVSSNPQSGSTYSAVTVQDFVDYAESFMYMKSYQLAGNRKLISDKNFKVTLDISRTLIDSSATCIIFQDQYSSQRCIENVVVIEDNPNMFY